MEKSIYTIGLHEKIVVSDGNLFVEALRVPGGWIYSSIDKSSNIGCSTFVPFDNGFWNPSPTETKSEGQDGNG